MEKLTAEKAKVDQAELEARSLERRIQLLEDNLSKCEERIERKTEELKESEAKADEAERRANSFENRNRTDDEKIDTLEEQLKVAKANAEESDAKYNEVMRKMTMLQSELEKTKKAKLPTWKNPTPSK